MPVRPVFPGEGSGNSSGAVNSVNGEQGDVVITAQDLNAQPASTLLTEISSITMPNNSLLMVDNSGEFTATACMPAAVAWLSYTTVDQQKDHLALAEVASSGDYNDLTNKPTLFDGTYASLTGKPTTFSPAFHTHAISDVTGLETSLDSKISVGASIPYNSLTGTPTIPAAQVNSDWAAVTGVSQVLNKPVLSTVATSGNYNDLTNKPVIPSVNYPVTSVNTKVGAVVLTNTDVGAAASVHTHTISDVTGLQSSLDSKASTAALSNYATTNALSTATTGLRKVETFLGTTDASGNFTITFANAYTTPPDVQPQIVGGTFNQSVRVVSVTNTGCIVQAGQRNTVTLLATEVLLAATVALAGASVTVQITSRT
jgi:hypothetical protein